MALYTGLRAGEIAAIEWPDIDLERRIITVMRSFDGPTKSDRVRYPRGLSKPSSVLVDMVRAVDKGRVKELFAPLPAADMKRVEDALCRLLAL